MQVAAAVLELLVNASLMMQPIDADALTYVYKTARLLQVILLTRHSYPLEAGSSVQRWMKFNAIAASCDGFLTPVRGGGHKSERHTLPVRNLGRGAIVVSQSGNALR